MSRREAAALLGFASEFRVRQLEKQGRLHPIRGVMASAWYPRSEVMALREVSIPARAGAALRGTVGPPAIGRWSDADLIGHLRGTHSPRQGGDHRAPTVVDLVADTGVSIARAERVYRFWLAHDHHPGAVAVRAARVGGGGAIDPTPSQPATEAPGMDDRSSVQSSAQSSVGGQAGERRGGERLERDSLILRLRNPDPAVRALAFRRLKDKQRR